MVRAIRKLLDASLSDRCSEGVWLCPGGFYGVGVGRKGSKATLAGKRAGGPGSMIQVAQVQGKGVFVSGEEAGFDSLQQLFRV